MGLMLVNSRRYQLHRESFLLGHVNINSPQTKLTLKTRLSIYPSERFPVTQIGGFETILE